MSQNFDKAAFEREDLPQSSRNCIGMREEANFVELGSIYLGRVYSACPWMKKTVEQTTPPCSLLWRHMHRSASRNVVGSVFHSNYMITF